MTAKLTSRFLRQISHSWVSMACSCWQTLYLQASNHTNESYPAIIQQIAIALSDCIMRHGGTLQTLEPIVDGLAQPSNQTQQPAELLELCEFMARAIGASSEVLKSDLEQTNLGRPWRILHVNYGITATRSHNTELMCQEFDKFISVFPQEASQFFAQGMQEMERLGYPQHVRTVVQGYRDHWTKQAYALAT